MQRIRNASPLDAALFFSSAVRRLLMDGRLTPDVIDYILHLYHSLIHWTASTSVRRIYNASLFCHNYGSSIKILVLDQDNRVLNDDPFWLQRLPFVCPSGNSYFLHEGMAQEVPLNAYAFFTPIIHHNHFGHFIADTLGQLEYLIQEGLDSPLLTFQPLPHIREEFLSRLLYHSDITYLPLPPVGSSIKYTNLSLSLRDECPWLYALYLLRNRVQASSSSYISSTAFSSQCTKLCFMLRKGSSNSRIANRDEIISLAKMLNADIIHAENLSINEMSEVLSSYRVIVTEAGSCHLNAMILSTTSSHIIALTPQSMLHHPPDDMIVGGWKYIPFHPNVHILPSVETVPSPMQPLTAWLSKYDPSQLVNVIRSLQF